MTVYLVMFGGVPCRVFSDEARARAYTVALNQKTRDQDGYVLMVPLDVSE